MKGKCTIPPTVSFSILLSMTAVYFFVELVVGFVHHSLVLQADAYHMLSDVVSLVVGFVANKIVDRNAVDSNGIVINTFGWARSEVVGALINSIFLVALCVTMFIEALTKFSKPEKVHKPLTVLAVSVVGLVINLIGIFLFHGHAHSHSHNKPCDTHAENISPSNNKSTPVNVNTASNIPLTEVHEVVVHVKSSSNQTQMNMKGVYLHILFDLLGSIIVIISCILTYYFTGRWVEYLDPSLSIISIGLLFFSTIPLAKKATKILIQTVPYGFDVYKIQSELKKTFPVIVDIHDFHLWQLSESKNIASIHIKFNSYSDFKSCRESIKKFFHSIGVHSLTLQPEIADSSSVVDNDIDESACLLDCPKDANCKEKQCC